MGGSSGFRFNDSDNQNSNSNVSSHLCWASPGPLQKERVERQKAVAGRALKKAKHNVEETPGRW
jgi:hypothetical protein